MSIDPHGESQHCLSPLQIQYRCQNKLLLLLLIVSYLHDVFLFPSELDLHKLLILQRRGEVVISWKQTRVPELSLYCKTFPNITKVKV